MQIFRIRLIQRRNLHTFHIWHKTYHEHYRNKLKMSPATHDPWFLFTAVPLELLCITDKGVCGGTCLQTDVASNVRNLKFVRTEEILSSHFNCKDANQLTEKYDLYFNGAMLSHQQSFLFKKNHIAKLKVISPSPIAKLSYISQRAGGALISSTCRADFMFGFAVSSQVTTFDECSGKRLNKFIERAMSTSKIGLAFVPLKTSSLQIAVLPIL